ncbi:hypothetical protein GGR17_000346 [Confluentimicrobium naphthalenivorans]|jgi:hypothetical protein|uniref:Uncharacterized protein n=1 Tax=Actibacterium naphthalenivorans TaxID=1614693 RepID=A0A840C526_9RHOB|nr:hypothetical protein [Actibacterium naphthalenivorans]|tara:strand:+ start:287 stop:403 length:117 start_codon:yes stop_codon:yes gene_type:complete
MILQAAKTMLVRDRMDWHKPHLSWVPDWNYRLFRNVKK